MNKDICYNSAKMRNERPFTTHLRASERLTDLWNVCGRKGLRPRSVEPSDRLQVCETI